MYLADGLFALGLSTYASSPPKGGQDTTISSVPAVLPLPRRERAWLPQGWSGAGLLDGSNSASAPQETSSADLEMVAVKQVMVRVVPTPEPLGAEPEGVSGLDDLADRYTSTDRRPLAGSTLDREHSREMLDPLLHREQT